MRLTILGCTLLCISAFLYTMRHIAAAILAGPRSTHTWGSGLFDIAYGYVGSDLTVWAIISLLGGVACFVCLWVKKATKTADAQLGEEIGDVITLVRESAQATENEEDA